MNSDRLRQQISNFLDFSISEDVVSFQTHETVEKQNYHRSLISYKGDDGDDIPAFLLLPKGTGPFPAVLIHHQHNGERHLGKSEVCGLAGDPLQAFGPALAERGVVVLAPDSICFEDRRKNRFGIEPDEAADWLQHFNEMSYRLVLGDTLMRKVLDDATRALSLLWDHPAVDSQRMGILGHSYGGNTVLFQAALDERIRFACSSGAACTYKNKMMNQTGLEAALVIPGFATQYDIQDLVKCIAPRRALLVSSTEDKYSKDADVITEMAQETFIAMGVEHHLEHKQYDGAHALTQQRFDDIVKWVVSCCEGSNAA